MTHVMWTVIFVADYLGEYEVHWKIFVGLAVAILMMVDVLYLIPRLTRQYAVISYVRTFSTILCLA